MKKLISCMLVLLMMLPCVSIFASAVDDEINTVQINNEIKNNDEIQDYGDVQGFIDASLNLLNKAPEIQDVPIANNGGIASEKDIDTYSEFETCRLIVESEEKPDSLNSVGIASGFMDYHIVQFSNAYDTKTAFEYYSNQQDVVSVYPDETVTLSDDEAEEITVSEQTEAPERLNSWGADSTGFYDLKDYLIANDIPMEEVVVGVVDSGIDLEHEFFKGRLIETGFNVTNSGKRHSEEDTEHGHGTKVASVIVDSTPEKVKVASYKVIERDGSGTVTNVTLGLLQAIEDEVDIINTSLCIENWQYLISDAVEYAYENNIPVVTAAGNDSVHIDMLDAYPAKYERAITVAAIDKFYMPTDFTNYGRVVDVAAPGKQIRVADIGNSYVYSQGTSFSSPYTAAVCAMYKSLNNDCSVDEVEEKIKETASSHSALLTMHDKIDEWYGIGTIDAIGVSDFERQAEVKVNIDPGDYFKTISIELSSEGADVIYYTLDQTIPTKENGILYTGPIEITSGGVVLKAIAYSENKLRSKIFSGFYKSWIEEPEENFTINDNGKILSYTGNSSYLMIPETINDITVTDIGIQTFNKSEIIGIMLPKTVTNLSTNAFSNNETIKYVYGESVTEIGPYAFGGSKVLYVNFPNAEKVNEAAFKNTNNMFGINLPKLKFADKEAFCNNKMLYIYLPELEIAGLSCFKSSHNLIEIYIPKLKTVWELPPKRNSYWFNDSYVFEPIDLPLVETVYEQDFVSLSTRSVSRIEFSNLKELNGIPSSKSATQYVMVLPSTLEELNVNTDQLNASYKVYGTAGTLAEEWAEDKFSVTFIEITPETAVITDLPEYYKPYMGELIADVVGFNRTYQWYANTFDSNEGGTPIEGATNKKFNPANYPAPYYYCEVTSTDRGYEPMIIKTSACENRSLKTIDYSELEHALDKVPEDLSIYTTESRNTLEKAVEESENLNSLNQKQIDELAEKIEKAISDLKLITITLSDNEITIVREDVFTISAESELAVTWSSTNEDVATVDQNGVVTAQGKGETTIVATIESIGITAECKVTVIPKMFTVAWIVDNNQSVVTVNEGDKIIKPENPEKHGYTFIGWNKSIPNTMPSENLEFTALWEKNSHTVTWIIDDEKIIDNYHYGDAIIVPNNPAKEGYTFDGWDAKVLPTVPDKDLVYTVKWKINSYTVKWNVDSEIIEETYVFGAEITEPETPQKEGYTFIGWNQTIPDTMPSENVEFTAVFEKAVVTSVKIKSKPTKLDYIYKTDNLNLTGLTLEVSYSDGTKEIVNDWSEAKVTGFDNTKTGVQTVTVEYAGVKTEFNVTVSYAWWQWLIIIFLFGWIWY